VFTCVEWQVTLCDPIWQVTPRSSEVAYSGELYRLTFNIHIILTVNFQANWVSWLLGVEASFLIGCTLDTRAHIHTETSSINIFYFYQFNLNSSAIIGVLTVADPEGEGNRLSARTETLQAPKGKGVGMGYPWSEYLLPTGGAASGALSPENKKIANYVEKRLFGAYFCHNLAHFCCI